VAHLRQHGVPLALATSTSRATLGRKLAAQQQMREAFADHSCCGDEVEAGKPAPDCFQHLAERLGLPPAECLVLEDAPAGVAAATAAGMRVVAVPSQLQPGGRPSPLYPQAQPGAAAGCVAVLPSLLEFRPEQFGLPPFTGAQSAECSRLLTHG
jgi:beta-phosphoglucomutase-like phosphatase (HAD superfamily)